jgi:protein O-mannosyl-transferase
MEQELNAAWDSQAAYAAAKTRRLHQLVILLLCLLNLLAYSNSFHTGLPIDNARIVQQDSRIFQATPANIKLILTTNYWYPLETSGLYRPFATLSFLFNYAILRNGANPAGYHVVNLALQMLNAILVYFLVWRLSKDLALAAATAALWTLHPVLTEAVTNIVGRADILAGTGVLGGLLCYIRGAAEPGRVRFGWLASLAAFASAGYFSKENAIVLPALMVAYEFTFRRKGDWHLRAAGMGAVLMPLAIWWWSRSLILLGRLHALADNPLLGTDFWTARFTALGLVGKYLGLLLYPRHLSFDYSYNQIPLVSWRFQRWADWQMLISGAILALLATFAIASYRRRPQVSFWILFAGLTFIPTSNLIVLIGAIAAERFLYLPSIAFAVAVAASILTLSRRIEKPVLAAAVISCLCIVYGIRTFVRNYDWRSEEALAESAIAVVPNSFKSHNALAGALAMQGPTQVDRGIAEAQRALEIQSTLPDKEKPTLLYSLMGKLYRIKGESLDSDRISYPEGGAVWYRKALDILTRATAIDRLWNQRMREHLMQNGVPIARIPQYGVPELYRQIGLVYLRMGEPQRALETLKYGRKLGIRDPEFYGLMANVYGQLHDYDWQAIMLIEAARAFPSDPRPGSLLPAVYAKIDTAGCAIISDQRTGELQVNARCPLVHEHMCAAREDLVQLLIEGKRDREARLMLREAQEQFHCQTRSFNFGEANQ